MDEVAALVVDNGSGMSKAGSAGDDVTSYISYAQVDANGIVIKVIKVDRFSSPPPGWMACDDNTKVGNKLRC